MPGLKIMTLENREDLISSSEEADLIETGILLNNLCIEANLTPKYVAIAMNIPRMTLYSWFRGQNLQDNNQEIVKDLITILENDLIEGVLPVSDIQSAKMYLEEITGKSIRDSSEVTVINVPTSIQVTHKTSNAKDEKNQSFFSKDILEQADIQVMYELGESYKYDVYNEDKAFYLYKSAAEQGHIGAQYELGKLYENGVFKKKIDDECLWLIEPYIDDAEYWFRPDDDEWLWLIGPNIDEAEYWYRQAANQDINNQLSINAKVRLGELYSQNYSTSHARSDFELTVFWYTKAAKQGDVLANDRLGELYSQNYNTSHTRSDFELAVFWYTKSAEQEDVHANFRLGELYSQNYITSHTRSDIELAVFCYTKAAEQSHLKAMYNLGEIYLNNYVESLLKSDLKQALDWYTKAAEQGYAHAQYELGEIYSNNYLESLLEVEFNLAVDWYTKAAQQKDFFLADDAYKKQRNLILDKPCHF